MIRSISKLFVQCIIISGMLFHVCHGLNGEEAVQRFFAYFREENPTGIPVLDLAEPLEIYSPLGTVPIDVFGGKIKGHSGVTIKQVFVDFLSLTGTAKVSAPRIELFGNYTWPGFIYSSDGFLNTTIFNMSIDSNFTMFIDQSDMLTLTDFHIHQVSEENMVDLTELIWEHELLVSSGAISFFFDEIALEVFRQFRPFLLEEVNREVSKFILTLPRVKSFISAEDKEELASAGDQKESKTFAILLNRLILYLGMEPLRLPDKATKVLGMGFQISDLLLKGTSSVNLIDSFFVVYQDKMMYIDSSMTFTKLLLSYTLKMLSGSVMNFNIYEKVQLNNVDFKLRLTVDPSLKTSPKIRHLDIDVGSFGKVRVGRRKSFWGRVSRAFSKFEDSIMKQVVNALQGPLTRILQKELDRINIEEEILKLVKKD